MIGRNISEKRKQPKQWCQGGRFAPCWVVSCPHWFAAWPGGAAGLVRTGRAEEKTNKKITSLGRALARAPVKLLNFAGARVGFCMPIWGLIWPCQHCSVPSLDFIALHGLGPLFKIFWAQILSCFDAFLRFRAFPKVNLQQQPHHKKIKPRFPLAFLY